ncbi:serine/arginine repetitive matrix protein 2 [Nematostella vectensis]|uniref:serine/arginine repetitive matrix protein 2 n=1 Tax=Nematostella vectensis TaxID=45351 RepID=UPI0013904CE1|nr:serine/arginine repetitive matrix protein 2 [Nematostella vectensis]
MHVGPSNMADLKSESITSRGKTPIKIKRKRPSSSSLLDMFANEESNDENCNEPKQTSGSTTNVDVNSKSETASKPHIPTENYDLDDRLSLNAGDDSDGCTKKADLTSKNTTLIDKDAGSLTKDPSEQDTNPESVFMAKDRVSAIQSLCEYEDSIEDGEVKDDVNEKDDSNNKDETKDSNEGSLTISNDLNSEKKDKKKHKKHSKDKKKKKHKKEKKREKDKHKHKQEKESSDEETKDKESKNSSSPPKSAITREKDKSKIDSILDKPDELSTPKKISEKGSPKGDGRERKQSHPLSSRDQTTRQSKRSRSRSATLNQKRSRSKHSRSRSNSRDQKRSRSRRSHTPPSEERPKSRLYRHSRSKSKERKTLKSPIRSPRGQSSRERNTKRKSKSPSLERRRSRARRSRSIERRDRRRSRSRSPRSSLGRSRRRSSSRNRRRRRSRSKSPLNTKSQCEKEQRVSRSKSRSIERSYRSSEKERRHSRSEDKSLKEKGKSLSLEEKLRHIAEDKNEHHTATDTKEAQEEAPVSDNGDSSSNQQQTSPATRSSTGERRWSWEWDKKDDEEEDPAMEGIDTDVFTNDDGASSTQEQPSEIASHQEKKPVLVLKKSHNLTEFEEKICATPAIESFKDELQNAIVPSHTEEPGPAVSKEQVASNTEESEQNKPTTQSGLSVDKSGVEPKLDKKDQDSEDELQTSMKSEDSKGVDTPPPPPPPRASPPQVTAANHMSQQGNHFIHSQEIPSPFSIRPPIMPLLAQRPPQLMQQIGQRGAFVPQGPNMISQGPRGPLLPQGPRGAITSQGPGGPIISQAPRGPMFPQGPGGLIVPQGQRGPILAQGPEGLTMPQALGGPTFLKGPSGHVSSSDNQTSLLALQTSSTVIPFLDDGPKDKDKSSEQKEQKQSGGSPMDTDSSPEVDIIEKMNEEFWKKEGKENNAAEQKKETEYIPEADEYDPDNDPVIQAMLAGEDYDPPEEQKGKVDKGKGTEKQEKEKEKIQKEEKEPEKSKVQTLLDKLHRQARVEEEVKLVLKVYFKHKEITKEEYKSILRRAVPQVANSSHSIDPERIRHLVKKYVAKVKGQRFLKGVSRI